MVPLSRGTNEGSRRRNGSIEDAMQKHELIERARQEFAELMNAVAGMDGWIDKGVGIGIDFPGSGYSQI